jgi:hypothetical protein
MTTNIEVVHDKITEDIDSESESENIAGNIAGDDTVPAPAPAEPAVDIDWSSLKVKNLTKAQRSKLIQDSEAGIENQYFKVQQMRNGTTRIVKRSNPLNNDAESSERDINNRYTGKRLTTEQLLLEHVLDLERKYEVMRQKHKRLKKRYNKLETDIYDSDDEPIAAEDISRAVEPEPAVQENPVRVKDPETFPAEPIVTATFKPRNGKPSWRSMIVSM